MSLLRRLLAIVVMLLSVAGFAACVCGIVYTWRVIGPLTDCTRRVFGRVDDTLEVGGRGLDAVLAGLRKGRADLEDLKNRPAGTDDEVQKINYFEKLIAQQMVKQITPQPGAVRQGLSEVHDASIILQSLLGQVNDLPVGVLSSVEAAQVQAINEQLTGVEKKSQELSGLLAQVIASPSGGTNRDEVSRTAAAVDDLIGVVTGYQKKLQEVENEVAAVRARTFFWLGVAPAVITAVLGWLALSQLSLLAHAWSWFKGRAT